MKEIIVVLSLLTMIAVSMLGVTLSSYVKELQLFGSGWLGPKYFAFELDSDGGNEKPCAG